MTHLAPRLSRGIIPLIRIYAVVAFACGGRVHRRATRGAGPGRRIAGDRRGFVRASA